MNRLAKIVLKNILYVPGTFFKLFRYAKKLTPEYREARYKHLHYIVQRAKATGDFEIKVFGRENIPAEGGFIFYPNHQGIFDGFAMIEACPYFFSPVIKKELMDYPVVKQIFECLESMPMDREDVRQSMQVMQEVTKRVAAGDKCLIFPEGTRSRTGNELLEFKGGSFRPALKAKTTIIPVALIDSFKPFDAGAKGHIVVQVHILKPIPYEEFKDMKTTELAEHVKSLIWQTIQENQ